MARRCPWGSMPDGTILGFADAQRAARSDMLQRMQERSRANQRRCSYEDPPVYASRLEGVLRDMRPELEGAGVEVALDDSDLNDNFKGRSSPPRTGADELRSQASSSFESETPDSSSTTKEGEMERSENEMMLVDRPLPQHIFVPTWVYFARAQYQGLWKNILKSYFTHYRWPKFTDSPRWFIKACLSNGISPDKYERTPGFAPVWVFYLRDLVQDRLLGSEWFRYCLTEFFDKGSFPNLQEMPTELQNMCAQDSISENDFVEVVGA